MEDIAYFLDSIGTAASLNDISRVLLACRATLDVANIAYQQAPVTDEMSAPTALLVTYEDSWIARYFAEGYGEIDPIPASGRRAFLPVDWMDVDRSAPRVAAFFRDAERHGVGRHGLTVPVRGPAGRRAIFVINADASHREWLARRADLLAKAHVLGHYVHARAVALEFGSRRHALRLSKREVQCLRDAAHGKLQKVIAFERGLSESAVRLYLSSAKSKLGCGTLPHAVAKALTLDLVGLD